MGSHLRAVTRRIARRGQRLLYVVVPVPHDSRHVSIAHDVRPAVESDRHVGVRRGEGGGRGGGAGGGGVLMS